MGGELGRVNPVLGHLVQARESRPREGKLRGDEETVEQHQQECHDDPDRGHRTAPSAYTTAMIDKLPGSRARHALTVGPWGITATIV